MDLHCRRLLSRLYGHGSQTKHDLRDRGSDEERFQPRTLETHLQHLEDQRLVKIERIKSSDVCQLTPGGEKLAGVLLARETGRVIGPPKHKLDRLFADANADPPIIDDFNVRMYVPADPKATLPRKASIEQLHFHRRRRVRDPAWYGLNPDVNNGEMEFLKRNLSHLSSSSVVPANPDLHPHATPGWETIQVGRARLPFPAADPGLDPNNWQDEVKRRFEIDSAFKNQLNDQLVELPEWFQQ